MYAKHWSSSAILTLVQEMNSFNFHTSIFGGYHYFLYLIDKVNEAEKVKISVQGNINRKWRKLDCLRTLKLKCLSTVLHSLIIIISNDLYI